jgi:phospholipase C
VASGPGWKNTVFIINYDEWGGFFEHVPARRVTAGVPVGADPSTGVDQDLDAKHRVLTGFRVPCIIASPFARAHGGHTPVNHRFFDHTSVLKLIEWRWGLAPLTQRDASSSPHDPANLAHALDFASPDPKIPNLPVLAPFVPTACTASPASPTRATLTAKRGAPSAAADGALAESETWVGLRQSQLLEGWA